MPKHIRGTNRYRFVYLIRHGDYVESDDHFGGLLTERGKTQAQHLAAPMSKIPVDAIYSSTMHRAYQTAEILRKEAFPELEVQRTPWLKERKFPGWPTADELDDEEKDQARTMLDKVWDRFFCCSRSERHDVLVCHGNVIRALLTRALEAPLECWSHAAVAHCGISQLVCLEDDVRLISYNERGHLPYRLRAIGSGDH